MQDNIIRLQSRKTHHASMNMLIGSWFTSGLPVTCSLQGCTIVWGLKITVVKSTVYYLCLAKWLYLLVVVTTW